MSKPRVSIIDLFDRPTMAVAGGTLLLFALGFSIALSGWDEFTAGRCFRKALSAWRDGQFLEAIAMSEEAARILPGYEDAEFLALAVKERTGEPVTDGLGRSPRAAVASQAAALPEGSVDASIATEIERTSRQCPSAPEPLVNLAACAARKGDLDRTEGFLRKVLAGKETEPAGWRATLESLMGLATLAERRGNLADSACHLERARWVAGRAEPPAAGSSDLLPGLILTVELRRERLRLLTHLAAGTLPERDVAAAEALVRKVEGVRGIDPAAFARLANLVGTILVRDAAGAADGPVRDRADAMFSAAGLSCSSSGCRDPVPALNRLALSAGASRAVPAPDGKALASWRGAYAGIPFDRLPPQAGVAAGHNRILLDFLGGENPDVTARRLEEVARRPGASPVAWRNLSVLYERMDLPARADECRRQAESVEESGR